MGMIEKINEIKKSLEEMIETKRKIKESLENKFGKDIGDDFTKYPEMIDEVWAAGGKIDVGETVTGLFSTTPTFRNIWDFSNTTNFYHMLYNSTPPSEKLEEKIEIDVRNSTNYGEMLRLSSSDNQYDPRKHFRIQGLPKNTDDLKTIINNIFSYLDNIKWCDDIIEIDEEKDLKGRNFNCSKLLEYCDLSNTQHLPSWLVKIFPYIKDFEILSTSTITLTEDIEIELCKEREMINEKYGTFFNINTEKNIHFYLYNDYKIDTGHSLFDVGKCGGTIRIDGPGCMIFTRSGIVDNGVLNRIGHKNFKGNKLEIKFKIPVSRDQNFSNFKDVRFLDGTEFYSVSNLPYTTRKEWIDFFNSLPDNSTSTYSNTIKINSEYYNLLTEEDILISTEKGYIITSV